MLRVKTKITILRILFQENVFTIISSKFEDTIANLIMNRW